jgi:hypothetical protein
MSRIMFKCDTCIGYTHDISKVSVGLACFGYNSNWVTPRYETSELINTPSTFYSIRTRVQRNKYHTVSISLAQRTDMQNGKFQKQGTLAIKLRVSTRAQGSLSSQININLIRCCWQYWGCPLQLLRALLISNGVSRVAGSTDALL